jgi:hypothetical protein
MTERARPAIGSEAIEAVADRGYYSGEEILACEEAGVTVASVAIDGSKFKAVNNSVRSLVALARAREIRTLSN